MFCEQIHWVSLVRPHAALPALKTRQFKAMPIKANEGVMKKIVIAVILLIGWYGNYHYRQN